MANKPGEANFFPNVPTYPEIGTFQPIYGKFDLTTYIQGASDYEIMAFLVGKYNATLEAYGTVTKLSTETITAAHQLQDWINNWFDNLDVQQELNNKIDNMIADGTFGMLLHQTFDEQINQQTTNAVTAWLVANVTPTGSAVIVDSSLSIAGAAADAKVTGTNFGNLFTTENVNTRVVQNYYTDKYNQRHASADYNTYVIDDLSKFSGRTLGFTFSGSDSASYTVSSDNYTAIIEHFTPSELPNYITGTPINTTFFIPIKADMKILQVSYSNTAPKAFYIGVWYNVGEHLDKLGIITPELFGAIGDGITDDTQAFTNMLSYKTAPILLTKPKYKITSSLSDTIGHTFLPSNSIISCNSGEFAFNVNVPLTRMNARGLTYNLNIDCENSCNGINIKQSIGNSFNITIKNPKTIGFQIDRNTNANVYENNINISVDSINVYDTGVKIIGNDNTVNNAIIINAKTAIINSGNTFYNYIHAWLDRNAVSEWEDSVIFNDISGTAGGTINYLYADTYKTGVLCENYSAVNISTYYALVNTNEIPIETVIASKHVAFDGNGHLTINTFNTYQDGSIINLVKSATYKPRIVIYNANATDLINTLSISQSIIPCGLNNKSTAFTSLPTEIQNSYTDSVVSFKCVNFSGSNWTICRYYSVNKIFINFNVNITPDNWNSIQIE